MATALNSNDLKINKLEACTTRGTLFWNLNGTRGAVVPYDNNFTGSPVSFKQKVEEAISALNNDDRLRVLFRSKTSADDMYVKFIYDTNTFAATQAPSGKHIYSEGNAAYQWVKLGDTAKKGNIMHELMHVLGFAHEHQRTDGQVVFDFQSPVYKRSPINYNTNGIAVPPGSSYDIKSIMHYPLGQCSAIGLKKQYAQTLLKEVYNGDQTKLREIAAMVGQREQLSLGDVDAVTYLYGSGGCTYTAFLHNLCQHKYFEHSDDDGKTVLSICDFCHTNCYQGNGGTLVEPTEKKHQGFVCACAKKDHANDAYEIHIDEFKIK